MLAQLELRAQALPKQLAPVPHAAKALYDRLTQDRRHQRKPRPSIDRAHKIIASAIVDSIAQCPQILTLAHRTISDRWGKVSVDSPLARTLAEALPILREPSGDVREKLNALAALNRAADDINEDTKQKLHWHHIEQYILDGFFSWPLLVDQNYPTGHGMGLSLPIYLSADFSKPGSVELYQGQNRLLAADWGPSLNLAARAAKDLWRKEGGHFGYEWSEVIRSGSQLVVDLSPADTILSEIASTARNGENFAFPVDGRSAELTLALGFFGRLRGACHSLAIGATGMIDTGPLDPSTAGTEPGERVGYSELSPLDRRLIYPVGTPEKMRWVDAAGTLDIVILPRPPSTIKTDQQEMTAEAARLQNYLNQERAGPHLAEVNWCGKLSTAADAVFGGEWRRSRFVRCVELSAPMFEATPTTTALTRVLSAFRAEQSPVVIMPKGVSAIDVVSSIGWLNSGGRPTQPGKHPPPMLAVASIRLVPDEGGDRLCGVLCDVAGAPIALTERICMAANTIERASGLAEALNNAAFDPAAPGWRPPDLMVLTLPEEILRLMRSQVPISEGSYHEWAHVLAPLLDPFLAQSLRPTVDPRWNEKIGAGRIVFVADNQSDSPKGDTDPKSQNLPPIEDDGQEGPSVITAVDVEEAFDVLSTFRAEFTQQQASVLLKANGFTKKKVRRLLYQLEEQGLAREFPGAWILTARRPDFGNRSEDVLTLFRRNLAAAVSFAPQISAKRYPGLADFEARKLHRIHEAQFHLAEAISMRMALPERRAQSQQEVLELSASGSEEWDDVLPLSLLRALQERLRCLFDVPGWDIVHEAAADSNLQTVERIDIARTLLSGADSRGQIVAITHTIALLRLINRRQREIEKNYPTKWAANQDEEWRQLTHEARDLIRRHLLADLSSSALVELELPSVASALQEEDIAVGIGLAAELVAVFLSHTKRVRPVVWQRLNSWTREAILKFPKIAVRFPPSWFEMQGDAEKITSAALTWYQSGYRGTPTYIQNWIKALGCLRDEDEAVDDIALELTAFWKTDPRKGLEMKKFARATQDIGLRTHRRWGNGLQHLLDRNLV